MLIILDVFINYYIMFYSLYSHITTNIRIIRLIKLKIMKPIHIQMVDVGLSSYSILLGLDGVLYTLNLKEKLNFYTEKNILNKIWYT